MYCCLQGSVFFVPSGSGHLCFCVAQFVTLHTEPGEDQTPARGDETCTGIPSTSLVWLLVKRPKHLFYSPVQRNKVVLLIILRIKYQMLKGRVPHIILLSLLFSSILSQGGKCVAAVRAALVQCLVALLEVKSQRFCFYIFCHRRCHIYFLPFSFRLTLCVTGLRYLSNGLKRRRRSPLLCSPFSHCISQTLTTRSACWPLCLQTGKLQPQERLY